MGEKAEAAEVYEIYGKDVNNCKTCSALWRKLKDKEEEDIAEMKQILLDHVKNGLIV